MAGGAGKQAEHVWRGYQEQEHWAHEAPDVRLHPQQSRATLHLIPAALKKQLVELQSEVAAAHERLHITQVRLLGRLPAELAVVARCGSAGLDSSTAASLAGSPCCTLSCSLLV